MDRGKIIFLNGVSSSGKSTLSVELIKRLPDFFHMSIDDYDIFVERMEDRENGHLIPVETWDFFHHTIAMFSDKGVNLVVDHVLHDKFASEHCHRILSGYPVLFVGVHCPAAELERRERERGDRHRGLAVRQLEFVHRDTVYDVEVDTFHESMEQCCDKIVNALHKEHYPCK